MKSMGSIFQGLTRTFSEDMKVFNAQHPVRTGRWLGSTSDGEPSDQPETPKLECRTRSLPTRTIETADSVSDASETLSVGSPTAACLDSPTSATAATAAQQRKKQYKIHGMDPYDYWSLIKGL